MHINKVLYFGDFFVMPVALAAFAWLAFHGAGEAAAPLFLASLAAGLLTWTFAEYWIHRYFYHHAPVLSVLHERHHASPKDYIGAPSFLSAGVVILLSYGPFFYFAPRFAAGFACGALIGYAAYMFVHHAVHHWSIAPGHWLYRAKVRHMVHHGRDDAEFGIVTGFWDGVFGTSGRRRNRMARV
jgi:sterol desaturase/sphingolipid hydroxylase (fatty acid hydroxylase superfamily)